MQAFLDRIESVNPKVNAFITVTGEHAMKQARKAEREIATGSYRGPLHGMPYAPKDMLATKGIRTTNGSKVTSDWIPRLRIDGHRAPERGGRHPDRQPCPSPIFRVNIRC